MKVEITMPKMGESITEGTIIKWHKKPGDKVKKDEVLYEISTDKVDTEIPSPADGVVTEILVPEQETVLVDTLVATIDTEGIAENEGENNDSPVYEKKELMTAVEGEVNPAASDGYKKEIIEPDPITANLKKEEHTPAAKSLPKEEVSANVEESEEAEYNQKEKDSNFYSPLVLNIARKEKVTFEELESLKGTGINGRVTKNDILDYIKNRPKEKPVQPKPTAKTPQIITKKEEDFAYTPVKEINKDGNIELIPMDNIRQKIMQHMINSRDTSVHVSGIIEVDMTRIHNFIKKNKDEYQKKENIKLTFMPFIAHACINALKENPYLNASIDGNSIVLKKFINLGFAVALEPNGLIVPNIKNADEKNIRGLAKSINELSDKARTKRLTPDDISNGTFTITNYGIFGTLFGTPIINQPEVAILGVGTVTKKPVVIEVDGADTIAVRSMMYLSLSHDHRLVDGMAGGKFLKMIKDTLENFDTSNIK